MDQEKYDNITNLFILFSSDFYDFSAISFCPALRGPGSGHLGISGASAAETRAQVGDPRPFPADANLGCSCPEELEELV